MLTVLLVAHIAVLGYWLGSELVINNTYRYVSWSAAMPFGERDRLMDHVLDVDQHVRYALILQAGLGICIAALLGYFPGQRRLMLVATVCTGGWLILTEATHRMRKEPAGVWLGRLDKFVRVVIILALLSLAGSALLGYTTLVPWFSVKLILFAGVIACGLGIRWALIQFYGVWNVIKTEGSKGALELRIRRIYILATGILTLLWILIAGIVVLSVWKP